MAADLLESQSAVLDLVYEASAEPERWNDALAAISTLLSGSGAMIHQHGSGQGARAVVYDGCPPAAVATCDRFYAFNPLTEFLTALAPGQIGLTDAHIRLADLRRTCFYADVLVPADQVYGICTVLWRDGDRFLTLSVGRAERKGPFGGADAAVFGSLLDHLRRALALSARLQAYGQVQRAEFAHLELRRTGVVVLDGAGGVLFANRAARADDAPLRLAAAAVEAVAHADATPLARLIGAVLRGGAPAPIRMRGAQGSPLVLVAAPLRRAATDMLSIHGLEGPAVVLFILDPTDEAGPPPQLLASLFDLTPAEARTAAALALGEGDADTARRLGVGLNTLKTHRRRVFDKVGVKRQAQLVRLFSALPASIGAAE